MMDRVYDKLIDFWLWDVEILSEPWLYIPLFIPFMFFLMFMMAKWAILTMPIWLPISIIVKSFREDDEESK